MSTKSRRLEVSKADLHNDRSEMALGPQSRPLCKAQRRSGFRPLCRMTQTAHSYWRRWNKRVLAQLSLLTATAQKIVQYSQSAFLPDYDQILSALSQVLWHHFSLPSAAMLIYQNIRPTEAGRATRLNKITFQTYAQVAFL